MSNQLQKKSLWQKWMDLKGWQRIMTGLVAGIVVGLSCGHKACFLKPIGSIFINAIHMMVVPVVFTAIVCAIISVNDPQKMRRVGAKTISFYALSMAIASTIGLTVATLIAPGKGLHLVAAHTGSDALKAMPSLTDMIVSMVPANPVSALADGNILQILVFAMVLGFSINMAGEKAEPVANFFRSLSTVVYKLATIVMAFAPYGIFALMACVLGEYGVTAILPLVKLIGTIYLCYLLIAVLFYAGTLAFVVKLSPMKFYKGIANAVLFAFSSSSSSATLPTSMKCAEENLGISKSISSFLLPLGTTLNLNGLSVYLSVATVFAANIYGVHLTFSEYLTIGLTIVLTCMGAGGVPGSAIFVMSAVMSSVGLPLGVIPMVAGVDRFIDMGSTTMNVTGDIFAALVVAKSEGELDEAIYNRDDATPAQSSSSSTIEVPSEPVSATPA